MDVFRSYSWSTNVCGCKEWLLYPPGQETHLCDRRGNLPFDATSSELKDGDKYPNASKLCGPIRVVQSAGETIFIPRLVFFLTIISIIVVRNLLFPCSLFPSSCYDSLIWDPFSIIWIISVHAAKTCVPSSY